MIDQLAIQNQSELVKMVKNIYANPGDKITITIENFFLTAQLCAQQNDESLE